MSLNLELGKSGEELAASFLKKNGYLILFKNYRTKLGEIDIIAKDKATICFVEVKARSSVKFGLPEEALSTRKQHQICRVALSFLKEKALLDSNARFDVVSILFGKEKPQINLIKNAFELI